MASPVTFFFMKRRNDSRGVITFTSPRTALRRPFLPIFREDGDVGDSQSPALRLLYYR